MRSQATGRALSESAGAVSDAKEGFSPPASMLGTRRIGPRARCRAF
jgi:hypothetical protein